MTSSRENKFVRLLELQKKLACELPAINKAIQASEQKVEEFRAALLGSDSRPLAEDTSIVFFGSLARGEWTSQSDPDWVLLIDGQVDEDHFLALKQIQKKLRELEENEPGTTRTFGELAFSHELVHLIGGIDHTNRNLTLRMLLLLESISIGSDVVRQRVLRSVLYRYLMRRSREFWSMNMKSTHNRIPSAIIGSRSSSSISGRRFRSSAAA